MPSRKTPFERFFSGFLDFFRELNPFAEPGTAERKARKASRKFEKAMTAELRRATPAENVKMGLSPKARNYVPATVKRVTRRTPHISARQYRTKQERERHGLTPEQATEARKQGAIPYSSAEARERTAKAAQTHEDKRTAAEVEKLEGRNIATQSPDPKEHGRRIHVGRGASRRYRELVDRKLAGEDLPDGEWHWMIDLAAKIKDKRYSLLRLRIGSPGAFTIALPGFRAAA
jgi:hypothetical protein